MTVKSDGASWSSFALRLLRGGGPALVSGAISLITPLLGLAFLSTENYLVWALASTLITIFLVLDFGTVTLAVSLSSHDEASGPTVAKLIILTAIPPIAIAAVVIALWPWYSASAAIDTPISDVALLFCLLGVGTALRSAGLVIAGLALGKSRFLLRAAILLSGAVVQLVAVFTLLELGLGYLSLGVATILGGLTHFIVAISKVRTLINRSLSPHHHLDGLIWRFAKSKGLVAVIGLSIMQIDRWALGLAGSAETVQTYDAASRLGSIPKVALVALLAGLVSDMGKASRDGPSALKRVYVRSSTIATTVAFAGAVAAAAGCWILGLLQDDDSALIISTVILAQFASALTIPITMYLSAVRKPGMELVYLVPMAALTYLGYYVGVRNQQSIFMIAMTSAALFFCSLAYMAYGSYKLLTGVWYDDAQHR